MVPIKGKRWIYASGWIYAIVEAVGQLALHL